MIAYICVFIAGTMIGSFLNVCIYRIPLGRSIVFPRSFCPFCEKQIAWYDNIPVISFIALRGQCRSCARPIPIRYPLVELVSGVSAAVLLWHFGYTAAFYFYALFTFALIAIVAIDIEHQEIPDVISLPGIVAGVLCMTFFRLDGSGSLVGSLVNSVLGVLAGGGAMFAMGIIGELIFKKEALGGGDVKLMAMIGAFLGWKLALLTFFLAPVLGAGVGLFMKLRFGKEVIPYGPYISLGALISLLYGTEIINYLFYRPLR